MFTLFFVIIHIFVYTLCLYEHGVIFVTIKDKNVFFEGYMDLLD